MMIKMSKTKTDPAVDTNNSYSNLHSQLCRRSMLFVVLMCLVLQVHVVTSTAKATTSAFVVIQGRNYHRALLVPKTMTATGYFSPTMKLEVLPSSRRRNLSSNSHRFGLCGGGSRHPTFAKRPSTLTRLRIKIPDTTEKESSSLESEDEEKEGEESEKSNDEEDDSDDEEGTSIISAAKNKINGKLNNGIHNINHNVEKFVDKIREYVHEIQDRFKTTTTKTATTEASTTSSSSSSSHHTPKLIQMLNNAIHKMKNNHHEKKENENDSNDDEQQTSSSPNTSASGDSTDETPINGEVAVASEKEHVKEAEEGSQVANELDAEKENLTDEEKKKLLPTHSTRWAICDPSIDLSGTWKPVASEEFKSDYDRYLTNCGEGVLLRKAFLAAIPIGKEIVQQSQDGKELSITGVTPFTSWKRTLITSGSDYINGDTSKKQKKQKKNNNKDDENEIVNDFNVTTVSFKDPDGDVVNVEAYWIENGTKHKSFLRGKPRVYDGYFESTRYLIPGENNNKEKDVLICEATFHPPVEKANPTKFTQDTVTWKFNRVK